MINLRDVASIDSRGLGEVVMAFRAVSGAGGAMALSNATAKVRDVMRMTHTDALMPAFPSEDVAVASLALAD
ncbi:MAG: STAS domain-containing protein [Acidobacteria bacterium]|nr:STAS domain-containing protein [Acidobacteriota bacterium]